MVNNTLETAWEIKESSSFPVGTEENQDNPQTGKQVFRPICKPGSSRIQF